MASRLGFRTLDGLSTFLNDQLTKFLSFDLVVRQLRCDGKKCKWLAKSLVMAV